jgi:hypothetical protein
MCAYAIKYKNTAGCDAFSARFRYPARCVCTGYTPLFGNRQQIENY